MAYRLEGSVRIPFFTTTIVGWAFDVMELIFLPYDLYPCSGQGILHRGTVNQLFIHFSVREESLSKGVDGNPLMAEGDGHLLFVEPSNIVTEWLATTLLDMVEIS